jgi:hypothetical protein
MNDIHPLIKKFWEDQGYKLERKVSSGFVEAIGIDSSRPNKYIAYVWATHISYYLTIGSSNFIYSEEEMLKIIKLKAFL